MDFDNLFPDEREKGETLIRQCQLVMIRMLKILDYLCNKYEVSYFLTGGTMLGAIRHEGFIPWDDDLDVGMTRDNYEKFVKYVVPELPQDMFFQNDETDAHYPSCHIMEAKLRDKYSRYNTGKRWHNGLQIDLSIYDRAYLPHNFFIYVLNRLLIFFFKKKGDRERAKVLRWISKHSPIPLVYSCSFIHGLKMIGLGTNYIKAGEIESLIRTKFESMETYIPVGWNGYLRRRYGNYMQLPPEEKQRGFHSDRIHYSDSNYMKLTSNGKPGKISIIDAPDPFTPCNHTKILYWKDRKIGCIAEK
jgi:lipopolysaccharide cholinephosphotransferase